MMAAEQSPSLSEFSDDDIDNLPEPEVSELETFSDTNLSSETVPEVENLIPETDCRHQGNHTNILNAYTYVHTNIYSVLLKMFI